MIQAVIGAQWGDEGKGKIVDIICQKADYAVRFHGGNNAGHTVINSYGKFPLHLVPSGIFNKNCITIISPGVIIDQEVLISEIEMLKKALPDFTKRLYISPRCHIIMPYHRIIDRLFEEAKGKSKTGTTGRGIGPTYADKVSYNGIRFIDFYNHQYLKERIRLMLKIKNRIIHAFGEKPLDPDQVYRSSMERFKKLKPYIKDSFQLLHLAQIHRKNIVFEGAQGIFLDNDWGTYPFVTASNVVMGNIHAGSGLSPRFVSKITGVTKAYTTRVGSGPFPTELFDDNGEKIRITGGEFGTTTGRPRRCGWLDLVLVKFAVDLNGFTDLVVTKLDILSGFPEIYICIGYKLNGKNVNYNDCDSGMLSQVKPVYKRLKGWKQDITAVKRFKDLPVEAQIFVKFIVSYCYVPVSLVSIGPKRDQVISVSKKDLI